ncbi:MAG: hypothetical protein ACXWC4_03805 [Telluria sp.]
MSAPSTESDSSVQEHCIDLPGETVQCWIGGGTDKLKVILRKHRDVVFDINLGNGKTYTLETTESDFYNARDKRIVHAARHGKVTFKDGERMHVWVSRGFRGALLLKCDNQVLSEVKPNEWDTHRHSNDPKEKPAPLIVVMGNHATATTPTASTKAPATLEADEQSLHVHEVTAEGAPPAILKFFQDGGESLHLDSENIITRNWILAQIAGAGGYVADNHTWIKELATCKFQLKRIDHKTVSKMYMIFSGNNRLREMMSASKYGLQHTKVMRIAGGASGVRQGWDATKGAAKDSLKVFAKEEGKMVAKGGGIAVVFTIGMDIAEWYKDYAEIGPDGKPKKDFYDLFAKVGTDLGKAGLIAALTTASVSLFFGAAAFFGVTLAAPVLVVVAGTIAVSIFLTYLVEKGDKALGHALGEADTTTWLSKRLHETGEYLSNVSKDVRYEHYKLAEVLPIGR